MYGGRGERLRFFSSTESTTKAALVRARCRASAWSWEPTGLAPGFTDLPPSFQSSVQNGGGASAASRALNGQYSSGWKARRAFSRSTMSLRATDWTRPAEMPRLTFFQRIGLIL